MQKKSKIRHFKLIKSIIGQFEKKIQQLLT